VNRLGRICGRITRARRGIKVYARAGDFSKVV
jgi:hypothetical protein